MFFFVFTVSCILAWMLGGPTGLVLLFLAGAAWLLLRLFGKILIAIADEFTAWKLKEPRRPRPDRRFDKWNAFAPRRIREGKYPMSGAVDIAYTDVKGQCSERYIEAKSLEARAGHLYLWGWCEQRQAMRSFRVDRIREMNDGETGEIIAAADISGWLTKRAGVTGVV